MDFDKLIRGIADALPGRLRDEAMSYLEGGVPKSWLRERVGEDAFGVSESIRAKMQPSDELWRFRSSEESWRSLAGREGIAIVRGGVVVHSECYLVS
jgi:hypothetical protein